MNRSFGTLINQPDTSAAVPAEQMVCGDDRRNETADIRTQLATLHASSFAWAMACCGRRHEDAEDVLHDVYARVLGDGARFDGRSSFKTWLFGVIARTAQSRVRRERMRALLVSTRVFRLDVPAQPPPPDEDAVAGDRRERTRAALERLSRRQRDVLLLVFYHDLTVEEAASVMRVSVGSARVHYQRGKARLAALLSGNRE